MTAFRFPIPTDIVNELKKYSIDSENDLLIFLLNISKIILILILAAFFLLT